MGPQSDLQVKHPAVAHPVVLDFQVHGVLEGKVGDLGEIELVREAGQR